MSDINPLSTSTGREEFNVRMGLTLDNAGKRINNILPPVDALLLMITYDGKFVIQAPSREALDMPRYVESEDSLMALSTLHEFFLALFEDLNLLDQLVGYVKSQKRQETTNDMEN